MFWTRSRLRLLTRRTGVALLALVSLVASACAPAAKEPTNPAPPTTPPTADRLVPPFKMLIPTPGYMPEVYEAGMLLVEQVKALGLTPEVLNFPSFEAYRDMVAKNADAGISMAGYVPREDRLDPDELLKFWTCQEAKDGGRNEAFYCNPEYDKAIEGQRSFFDPAKRKPFVLQAQEIWAKDLPAVVMMHQKLRHVYNQDKYTNVVSIPGVGTWNSFNFVNATPKGADTVFRAGWVTALPPLNPVSDTVSETTQDVYRLLYDTLTRVGPDGVPVPWAAEKWRDIDNKTLEITLREGLKFHDGKPVTIDDVVFSYNYFIKVKPAWHLTYIRPLEKAEKTGDRTAVISLAAPYSPLLLTTLGNLPILPKHIWENIADPRKLTEVSLIGSGPYKFKSQSVEQSYVLDRNDDHFMKPKSSQVLIVRYATKETQFLAMAKGDSFFHEQKGLPALQITEASKYPALKVLSEPSIDVRYMVFNMREGRPFRDYNLRHAVAHLLDFKTIEEVISKGLSEGGRGVIAPANKFYHNSSIPSQEGSGLHYHQYDMQKARKILQDAGYEWDKGGKLYFPKNHTPQVLAK